MLSASAFLFRRHVFALLASCVVPTLSCAQGADLPTVPATPERAEAARAQLRKSVPTIQIWSSSRGRARTTRLVGERVYAPVILDEADQTVLVRLAFDRSLAGSLCYLRLAEGWKLERGIGDDDEAAIEGNIGVRVRPNGRVAFMLRREPAARRGDLSIKVNHVVTHLRFVVMSAENQARLRQMAPGAAADLD